VAAVALAAVLSGCAGEEPPLQQPEAMPDANPVEYPVALWDRRVQGETLLMLHVDERGTVDSAYVRTSSGYPEFDSAAVAGGRRLRFTPGRRGDHSVATWTQLRVRFAPDSTASLGVPVNPDSIR
jgi:TonB family protein